MIDGSAAWRIYGSGAAVPLSGGASARTGGNAGNGNAGSGNTGAFSALLERSAAAPAAAPGRRPVIDRDSRLYEQCVELETFLLKTLVKSMRGTVMKSDLIDTGFAGEVYEDMLYDEYTKDLARNARLGLAETAYLELSGQRGALVENRFSAEA